mmetsp:Transcript_6551/g.12089  ORF Transcript_6551/g.12089 Transcript_6551/m.12089 type:complete len:224 (-) Transcript_6551:277-948(-)
MWRPGDPAPFAKDGKRKKSQSKSTKGQNKSTKKLQRPGSAGAGGRTSGNSSGRGKLEPEHEDDTSGFITTPSIVPDKLKHRVHGAGTAPAKLSNNLKNLKFMSRKEDETTAALETQKRLKREQEAKWVVDPSLVETKTGQLECEPLRVAPRALAGRRSFNSFNPVVEERENELARLRANDLEAQEINANAIDEDEMVEHFTGIKRGPSRSSGGEGQSRKKRRS